MTQQDKDREAFEATALERFPHLGLNFDRLDDGSYDDEEMQSAWEGWQAARDHYTPKQMNHDELFRCVKRALDSTKLDHSNLSKTGVIMNSLYAAGVRFKEDGT